MVQLYNIEINCALDSKETSSIRLQNQYQPVDVHVKYKCQHAFLREAGLRSGPLHGMSPSSGMFQSSTREHMAAKIKLTDPHDPGSGLGMNEVLEAQVGS